MNMTQKFVSEAAEAGATTEQIDRLIDRYGTVVLGGGKVLKAAGYRSASADLPRILHPDAATPRQIDYLRDLGATDEELHQITKAGASRLIDELKSSPSARAFAAGAALGIDGQIWD